MKPGLPLSIALHAAVLGWAMVSFAAAPPPMEAPPSEPIDVELLPPTNASQQKQGDTKGKPSDQITRETKAAPKESDGKRAGDTKTEEPPPPPPEQKPTPPQEKPQQAAVTPPPPPEPPKPEPKPDLSKLAKPDPVPVPPLKPDLPIEAEKAKAVGVGKPPEVKEPPKEQPKEPLKDEKALEKLLADAKKQEKPPEKPADKPLEKPVEKKTEAKPADKPTAKSEPVRTASIDPNQAKSPSTVPSPLRGQTSDIKNRVETGTASSRTEQHASLGNPNGPATPSVKLSQSEMEGLIGMLKSQINRCWSPPGGASESGVKVRLGVELNQDGTLKSDPTIELVTPASHPQAAAIAGSAIRAVKRCAAEQPFKLPADKYGAWATNHITFDPSQQ